MPLIDWLGADHEELTHLAGHVRRAIAAGDVAGAHEGFAELLVELRRHTELEEVSVFAALRAAHEMGDDVDALTAEHVAISKAASTIGSDDWDVAVLALLDDLREHIAREEYDVFPATLIALSPRDWDAAEAAAGGVRDRAL